jgi:hypothetical protein
VVGGGVIQRLAFDALPADGAWQIRDLEVQFPGRTELVVDGSMRSGDAPRFFGTANLVSSQPEVFTSWLTGGALQGSRLSRLDVSSRISIARGEVVAEGIEARLGDAEAGGRIVWEGKDAEAASTRLEAELAVDRVDFDDLAAFGRLVLGGAVGAPGELADRIAIDFSANTIESDDVALRDVSVVAGLADDTLTVETIQIGDVAGASLSVDQGRIAAISTRPSGEIVGRFQAETLEGVGRLVATLWPDSEAATWLEDVGATLVPLGLTARFSADAGAEGERFEVELEGAAAGSEIRATTLIAGRPMDWRSAASKTSLTIGNPVSAALAQQFGLPVRPLDTPLPGRIEVAAEGVVADSLSLTVGGEFAGARLDATGTLAGIESDEPGFTGSFDLESADIDPILLIAGKTLPGVGLGTPASLSGAVRIAADGAEVTLEPSTVGDREIVGNLTLRRPAGDWSFGGSLDVDSVDLPWLASLALGVAPEPTGEAAAPWPTLSFGQPVLGEVRGGLELSFGRLGLGPGLELTDGRLQVRLQPAALGLELLDGGLAGGTASGQVTIRNTVGDAAVRGEIGLSGANLAALSWSNGDQPAIDGLLELAADFETTGGSVAALAGSLTGGGEFSVAVGVIRKLDPTIFERAITETERGFDLTPGNLARMFDEASGEAALDFEAASGRFAIVAGEVRARNVAVDAGPVSLGGGGTIDMADLSLTSDWTMAFQPDDDLLADVTPTLGISFAGPVAAPVRTVNTEPLARYLSLRTLEQLERDREATLERRQIDRLARLQQIYADSVLAQEAAAREAAEAARLDAERRAQEEAERQKAEEDAARAASERDPTGIFSAPLPPPNPSTGESPPAGPSGGN